MSYIISNDKFIPIKEFKLDIDDGLLYGYGVFETVLIKDKKPVYLKEHYDRLIKGLNRLKIEFDITYEKLKLCVELYIQKNTLETSVLRINIFKNRNKFDILINHRENSYKDEKYRSGFKMEISEFKKSSNSLLANIKSINFLENIYALREAKLEGYDEVLFLNTSNYISEGAISNLFFIKDGIIYTPTKECGLLEGIIRGKIIDIIDKSKYLEVKLGFFKLNQLLEADEIFLTNSVMGVMPVSKVGNKIFDLKKNSITNMLMMELRNRMKGQK